MKSDRRGQALFAVRAPATTLNTHVSLKQEANIARQACVAERKRLVPAFSLKRLLRQSTVNNMSQSTPPSPEDKAKAGESGDWRSAVEQSYRNTEVREIARVLASLEPGAKEASKLRLAMQFEDAVFRSSTSLADYRKRLTKRLKKVQKEYKPTPSAPGQADKIREQQIQELRQQYGDSLRYILKHSSKAVKEMRVKYGEEKAKQLEQHAAVVRHWASDLGIAVQVEQLDERTNQITTITVGSDKPNTKMSDEHFERLKQGLEKRTDNVRSHVVKLSEPDKFMEETLDKIETDFRDKSRAVKLLAEDARKRYEQLQKKEKVDPQQMLTEALERANKNIPPPTKVSSNDQSYEERTALIHLDKMRAASTVMLAYLCVPDKYSVPRSTLSSAHSIATTGMEYVQNVMKERRKHVKEPGVQLQDAWMKPLSLPLPAAEEGVDGPAPKRPRHSSRVWRSRVLLTAGRKTPSNLVPALKRKRSTLVRPPPSGDGSHLILEFGKEFVMTIHFVPLLVTLRAYEKKKDEEEERSAYAEWKCASSTPLHAGLADREELSVWGVKGTYDTIGFAVEERLRDASAHATQTLRSCFSKAAASTGGEFEVEILEASALLEFLQLARTTYEPDWRDDDV
jgi:hypothetical protein